MAIGGGKEDGGGGRGELGDGLAAGSAGLARGLVEVGYDYGLDADGGAELRYGTGDCGLLGAGGQAVGGVFYVAAGDDFAGFEEDRGSDVEMAVGGVGPVGGGFGLAREFCELGFVGHAC